MPPARALAGYLEAESYSLQSRGQGCCPRGAGDAEAPEKGRRPGLRQPPALTAPRVSGSGPRTRARGRKLEERELRVWEAEYLRPFSKIRISHTHTDGRASAATPGSGPSSREMSRSSSGLGGRRPEASPICAPPPSHPGLSAPRRNPGSQPRGDRVAGRCSQWLRCPRLERPKARLPWDASPETAGEAAATSSGNPDVPLKRKKRGEERIRNAKNILGRGLIWA